MSSTMSDRSAGSDGSPASSATILSMAWSTAAGGATSVAGPNRAAMRAWVAARSRSGSCTPVRPCAPQAMPQWPMAVGKSWYPVVAMVLVMLARQPWRVQRRPQCKGATGVTGHGASPRWHFMDGPRHRIPAGHQGRQAAREIALLRKRRWPCPCLARMTRPCGNKASTITTGAPHVHRFPARTA